jgi:tetratricopeptide (TPR) repeat protein
MRQFTLAFFVIVVLFGVCAASVLAFQSHTLYGDFKVDENKGAGIPPLSYTLTLYALQGNGLAIARTTATANGRYRFNNIPNGEYELSVESGGSEVARINILLQERRSTDIRRDIALEVKSDLAGAAAGAAAGAVIYSRKPAAAADFKAAQQAVAAKNYAAAAGFLRNVVAENPTDFEAWTELGTVLFRQGNLDEAGKAFQQTLKVRPDFMLALVNLGKLQLARKQNEAAVATLSKAVQLQPQIAEAQFCLGEAYLQVKLGSKAVVHLNEALRLDPDGMADAHLRLAALYHGAGYKDRAAAEYEQYLKKRPDSADKEKLLKYVGDNKKSGAS